MTLKPSSFGARTAIKAPTCEHCSSSSARSDTVASRGSVETTSGGVPVFISALRAADARPLGSVVIELSVGNSRNTPSMVVSMLRPVLDCLERKLDLERSTLAADRSAGLDLLLGVDEHDREEASALQQLLRHCARSSAA